MCDTDSIVISNRITKEQFINGHELNKYIAFGLDDLNRAKSIRNEFYHHLDDIENKTIEQLHKFINKCYDYFK
jgi:hypothetical protein